MQDIDEEAKLNASMKAQLVAKTNKNLHDLTKAEVLGLGKRASQGHKVNTRILGNTDIFSGIQKPQPNSIDRSQNVNYNADNTKNFSNKVSAAKEFERMKKVQISRQNLIQLCLQSSCKTRPPIMAWERWQATEKLREQLQILKSNGNTDCIRDWILPFFNQPNISHSKKKRKMNNCSSIVVNDDSTTGNNTDFLRDLSRVGINECEAIMIANNMLEQSCRMVLEIKTSKNSQDEEKRVEVIRNMYSYDIIYCKKLLKLNISHFQKLKYMWEKTSGIKFKSSQNSLPLDPVIDPNLTKKQRKKELKKMRREEIQNLASDNKMKLSIKEDPSESMFHKDLYCMLTRYHSLLGHGMQCAASEHVFDCLNKHLKVDFECFASPLNSRYVRFCSAFPDVDRAFGSVGSFFETFSSKESFLKHFSRGGFFEANPPFINYIMEEMVLHIENLMNSVGDDDRIPLLFAIVVPGWSECKSWQMLQDSRYNCLFSIDSKSDSGKKGILIAAADHGYVSGAQHQRKDRYLESPFDSALFVLANNAAMIELLSTSFASNLKKGTIRKAFSIYLKQQHFEEEIRKAFANAHPTDAMKERRKNEGRGFGNKDGGGGVYKGKKSKKKTDISTKQNQPLKISSMPRVGKIKSKHRIRK